MSGADWFVMIGGITVIAWINWYFFLPQRRTAAAVIRERSGLDARSPKADTGRSYA